MFLCIYVEYNYGYDKVHFKKTTFKLIENIQNYGIYNNYKYHIIIF